ncbi:hypothetical protein KTC96_06420 [Clostridium estertheticum]|uniref:hypothetical protein n=1 Tax=Clostridium estertheticum TaxID=238834 RepID=UPI001C7E0237|nr:hypothetical protein [Clostridium estertheticum]MBX4262357.1 hypothetical protein [Clostridium estertheticum]WLC71633.1 hypothetical protein KTC96_06420 [Clostridium estertheticum]
MNLGDKLKALRKSKGLSLQGLSDLTAIVLEEKISISFLSDIIHFFSRLTQKHMPYM